MTLKKAIGYMLIASVFIILYVGLGHVVSFPTVTYIFIGAFGLAGMVIGGVTLVASDGG
jgi:glucose uptake protein GlcU